MIPNVNLYNYRELPQEKMMDTKDKGDNSTVADETDFFSQIEHMNLEEFRKYLQKKGYTSLYDLVTIPTYTLSKSKGSVIFSDTEESKLLKEIIFAYKYQLTKSEVETLKLMAKGYKNREIARNLDIAISVGAVAKRNRRIFGKLCVHNRTEASKKAIEEELI